MREIKIDLDVYKAIEGARLSFDESETAILRRLLGIDPKRQSAIDMPRERLPRSSGAYSAALGARMLEANSLKELVRRAILVGERSAPDLIEQLALIKTPKGRRVVAKSPAALYPKSPQLARYAERLNDEWWYDGNIGRNQAQSYLRTIARVIHARSLPTISKRSEKSNVTLDDILSA